MSVKKWLLEWVRDDAAHAEIDRREEKSLAKVDDLRGERQKNGFGHLFDRDEALRTFPPTYPTFPYHPGKD